MAIVCSCSIISIQSILCSRIVFICGNKQGPNDFLPPYLHIFFSLKSNFYFTCRIQDAARSIKEHFISTTWRERKEFWGTKEIFPAHVSGVILLFLFLFCKKTWGWMQPLWTWQRCHFKKFSFYFFLFKMKEKRMEFF